MILTPLRRLGLAAALSLCVPAFAAPALAQGETSSRLRGAAMNESAPIAENIAQSADLSTLFAAVKAARLEARLGEAGPFTLFAPDNAGFEKLPPGTVDELMKPEEKERLTTLLTYHVLPGRLTAGEALSSVDGAGGTHKAKTLAGEDLTFTRDGDTLVVTDARGGTARVTQGDVPQANGVIHVIDAVLMP